MKDRSRNIISIACILISLGMWAAFSVHAEVDEEAVSQLRENIDDRTSKIRALETEIEKYEQELDQVQGEKQTLQGAIRTLDISQSKLEAEQDVTQNKVSATTFEISKLVLEIREQERLITLNTDTLAESLRNINEADQRSFLESILSGESVSEVWQQVEDIQQFQTNLRVNLAQLRDLKDGLEVSRNEQEGNRQALVAYDRDLEEQGQALQITKNEKQNLLTTTQNKESNYRSLLEEKKAARAEFEQELLEFQSQLQFALDPTSIPAARHGILSWPLDTVRITQEFGDTEFARTGAYNGKGHNGVDFGARVGTPVKAALPGIVEATGNTDAFKGCYSYGKWILIRHNNGLSSLYAHLSHIVLGVGSDVETGDTIGYSGSTGYATGPHLHFSLFATQGVQVIQFKDFKTQTNCGEAYVPVAPLGAYLDPLQYFEE